MAEGLLRHLASDKFEVFSAGINPTSINPLAIKAMNEIGIDISRQRTKSINEFLGQQFDYIVTVCDNARQTCPVFHGQYEKIHWDLGDPAEAQGSEDERIVIFRRIRYEIEQKIKDWIKSIAV